VEKVLRVVLRVHGHLRRGSGRRHRVQPAPGRQSGQASERSTVQGVTQAVLAEIAGVKAARCCQRDGFIALTKAAELSRTLLPVALKAEHRFACRQMHLNKECLGKTCILHPIKARAHREENTNDSNAGRQEAILSLRRLPSFK
jgi:hypothetical protein